MNVNSSKTIGGIGAILMFIGVLISGYSFGIVPLVGLILVMVAMYGLSSHYHESGIFNNALYGVITAIVGVVLVGVIAVYALFGFFTELGLAGIWNPADWAALMQFNWAVDFSMFMDVFGAFIASILLALVVLFIFVIVTAILLRKSLGLLSAKTGIGLFGTTGTMILIGAVLTIIFIGAILLWISLLLLAVAFFQIKTEQIQPPPPPPV